MKKKLYIFLITITILILCFISFIKFNNKEDKINQIIESDAYSYLSNEVKEYIKHVYEETNEVVLTENNKEENKPYLNPEYASYLSLDKKEKEEIDLIPEPYIVEYNTSTTYNDNSNLPSKYDLRNINGKNYTTSIKNQGQSQLCWAFASIENVETLIMKKNQTETVDNFSIRQLDYATSNNFLAASANWTECNGNCDYFPYDNSINKSRALGSGGNFYTAMIAMANAWTLTDESIVPWNENKYAKLAKKVLGTDKTLYELDSSIIVPTITKDTMSQSEQENYVNSLKNYIMEYGGPFVGTYSPKDSTCGFNNIDGTKTLKTDNCVSDSMSETRGHAMQIIGWDDTYSYKYCENGTKHLSINNQGTCSTGQLVEGTGAWILRNSWGTNTYDGNNYKYVYLTYDSTRLQIGFVTSLSSMNNKTWDNVYYDNPWTNQSLLGGLAPVSSQEKSFNTNNTKEEKIEKIKFLTSSIKGTYNISITSGDKVYNDIAVLNSNEVGYYTIDLSDKNILVGETFSVKISSTGSSFYKNTIAVFTSNIDESEYAIVYSQEAYNSSLPLSNDNPLYTDGTNIWDANITSYLKNIPQNSELTYRIKKNETIANEFANQTTTIIPEYNQAEFNGSTTVSYLNFDYNNEKGNTWQFELLYDDKIIASFPIKFYTSSDKTSSKVRLYSNNGTNYYYEINSADKTYHNFLGLSALNTENFFNNNYYIKSWNTKPDGSGTNYNVNNEILIYKDNNLYAQWSNKKLDISLSFLKSKNSNTIMSSNLVSSSNKAIMPINTMTNEGYVFSYWKVENLNDSYESLYEEESTLLPLSNYVKYPVFNGTKFDIYAVWVNENNYATISFNPNGATGTMLPINIEKNMNSKIKNNLFTKEGYVLDSWNTESNGTGTKYTTYITTNEDITLYAQWEKTKTVSFNSNGGNGTMDNMEVKQNTPFVLTNNLFTKEGYIFDSWNTNPNGTGTKYNNKDSISINEDITLYVIWKKEKLNITYYSNDNTNKTYLQTINNGETCNLKSDAFTKEGYSIKTWNTNPNGAGSSYSNNEELNLTEDIVLYAIWEIKEYSVNTNINTGTITVNNKAKYNETVNFDVNIPVDCKIISLSIINDKNEDITNKVNYNNYSFTMPASHIFIKVMVTPIIINRSTISISNTNNNSLTLSINYQEDIEKYIVYRSTDNKKYTEYKTITTNTLTDTNLTYNKTYYYKVKGYNSIKGYTDYSNIASKKVVPNQVTNLKAKSITKNSIKLSFDKVGVTGYEIYRSTNNKSWSKVTTITKNSTTTYTNKKLKTNTTYYYKVRAYKTISGKKIYGSYSSVLKVRTAPDKGKVSVSLKDYNALNVKITSIKGATTYNLYRSIDNKSFTLLNTVSSGTYVDSSVELGKTYYYKVRACNSEGTCGSYSSVSKLKVTPKTPSMSLSTTSKKVTIKTNAIYANGYEVYRSTSKKGKYSKVGEINLETLTLENTTSSKKTYYYKIRSYIIVNGNKVYSSYSSIKSIKSK